MPQTRREILKLALAVPALSLVSVPAFAATSAIYANDGIAIDGTDPVSYFTQGKPVAGNPSLTHKWMGVTWQFSTPENRDTFAADPEAYAPQYGGYCAYAVSEGYIASTIPDAWKITDGKLYLNFSRRIQRRWERNISERISAGNMNWPEVLN